MVNENDGPFICLEIPDEETGETHQEFVSIPMLFARIWDEYLRGMIPDEYCRGMLRELGLAETEVFHMMERLQMGKEEWDNADYRERSYV